MAQRLIFDVDGTLLKIADFKESIRKLFTLCNVDYDEDNVFGMHQGMITYEDYYKKYTVDDYYRHLKSWSGLEFDKEVIEILIKSPEILMPDSLDKGIIETLDYLKEKYDLVVLTNYFAETQAGRLELFDLLKYFSNVYGAENYSKPDPRVFIEACGDYPKEECVMIGDDASKDYIGARRAGLGAILIDHEDHYNHTYRVKSFNELVKKL